MNVALITIYHVPNYGSILQAYATQRVLEKLGHECRIIYYCYPNEWHFKQGAKRQQWYRKLIKKIGLAPLHRKENKLNSFKVKYFNFTKKYRDFESLRNENWNNYDVFIVGSDQVWNPRFLKGDRAFLLSFVPKEKRRISIASSFAQSQIPMDLISRYKEELGKFYAISVREKNGVEIIQNQLKKRDNQIWDLNMITAFQQEELKFAKKIAVDKKIPLKIIYQNKDIMEWPIEEDKNIILSIRPIFAEKILSGEKKYEYRKRLCAKKVSKIYIYETAPVKKIIGEVEVIKKLKMEKEKLWKQTQKFSGISKEFYGKYFEKQEYACAYELGESKKYSDPVTLESIGVNYIPQSFAYYDGIITSTSSDTQTD